MIPLHRRKNERTPNAKHLCSPHQSSKKPVSTIHHITNAKHSLLFFHTKIKMPTNNKIISMFFPNQSKILTGMNKEPNSVARRRYRWYLKGAQTQDSGTGAGAGGLRSGCKAFTTILMLGLNSDSYCTHNAATAASCIAHITDS